MNYKLSFIIVPFFIILFACTNSNKVIKLSNQNSNQSIQSKKVAVFETDNYSSNSDSVEFKVDDVELANKLLETDVAKNIFENKLEKKILFIPKEHQNKQFTNGFNNAFIETVYESYSNHRPLILSPDIIWLAITQGTSIHINQKFKSLESKIFKKEKPEKLVVRNDNLSNDLSEMNDLIDSLSLQATSYTKNEFYNFFTPEFSTSTKINKTAFEITMLESYKKAFTYIAESGCGIPKIILKGNTKDWEKIYKNLGVLNSIGLQKWGDNLKPIIQEFINASNGNINNNFWKYICKLDGDDYGPTFVNGWVIKFFPYIKDKKDLNKYDNKTGMAIAEEFYKSNEFLDGEKYKKSNLTTEDFPSGLSKIVIIHHDYFKNTTINYGICSGFMAINQFKDYSIEPLISWAVYDLNSKKPEHEIKYSENLKLKHKN